MARLEMRDVCGAFLTSRHADPLRAAGAFLRPRDPAIHYCLAILYDLVHREIDADCDGAGDGAGAANDDTPLAGDHGTTSAPHPSDPDVDPHVEKRARDRALLRSRHPRCCVRRFLARALAARDQASAPSVVTCYLAAGAVDRHLAAANAEQDEAGAGGAGDTADCSCPGLVDGVYDMQRYRRSLQQGQGQGLGQGQAPFVHEATITSTGLGLGLGLGEGMAADIGAGTGAGKDMGTGMGSRVDEGKGTGPGAGLGAGAARRLFDIRLLGLVSCVMDLTLPPPPRLPHTQHPTPPR